MRFDAPGYIITPNQDHILQIFLYITPFISVTHNWPNTIKTKLYKPLTVYGVYLMSSFTCLKWKSIEEVEESSNLKRATHWGYRNVNYPRGLHPIEECPYLKG